MDPEEIMNDNDEIETDDEESHKKLMKSISQLGSKGRSKVQPRSEPSSVVSEFRLSSNSEDSVKLNQLLNSLNNTSSQSTLKKQLNNIVKKKTTLDVPLYAHEAEKIQRTVAYRKVKKNIGKWDHVVKTNRQAAHTSFPLNQNKIYVQSTEEFARKFKPSTSLELEVYKLLNGNKFAENQDKELTLAEEEVLSAMSLEEAQMRRSELQKGRALQSYYEAKCKRQKRIKSKKYHRIKRRGRAKEEAKKMEELKRTNPEEADNQLFKLEKIRAEERMRLRHRNTGKWAKETNRFGKYSQEARQQIADQLEQSRSLTQKIAKVVESDDEAVEKQLQHVPLLSSDVNNPWFTDKRTSKECKTYDDDKAIEEKGHAYSLPEAVRASILTDAVHKHGTKHEMAKDKDELEEELIRLEARRKFRKAKQVKNKDMLRVDDDDENEDSSIEDIAAEDVRNELEVSERKKMDASENMEAETGKEHLINEEATRSISGMEDMHMEHFHPPRWETQKKVSKISERIKMQQEEVNMDPSKVFSIKSKNVMSLVPDVVVDEDEMRENDHRMNIQEAFEDDGVVEEFKEEKEAIIEKGKSKAIDLSLPGWGEWGGTGVIVSEKKKKRFTVEPPPGPARKDKLLQHVIINEKRDEKLAIHQVNDLPYPFASVKQFQKSIRAPVGNTWNTPSAVAKFTQPRTSTKMGTIIEPIHEEVLKKAASNRKRNLLGPDISFENPKAKNQGKRKKRQEK